MLVSESTLIDRVTEGYALRSPPDNKDGPQLQNTFLTCVPVCAFVLMCEYVLISTGARLVR